jgi:hypothetical protein
VNVYLYLMLWSTYQHVYIIPDAWLPYNIVGSRQNIMETMHQEAYSDCHTTLFKVIPFGRPSYPRSLFLSPKGNPDNSFACHQVCEPFICEASQSSAFNDWHEAWLLVEEFLLVESETAILKLLRHLAGKAAGPEGSPPSCDDRPAVDPDLSRHPQSGMPENACSVQYVPDSHKNWAEGNPLEWRLTRSLASSRVIYEQWSRQTSLLVDDSEASRGCVQKLSNS